MTRARELAFIANENLLSGDTTNTRIGIGSTVPASTLDVKGSISASGDADFSGNITIGGTLTYQDVTNVDAVGIITANSGMHITGGGLRVVGVTTGLSVSGVLTTGNGLTNNYIKIGRTGNFVIDTVPGNNRLRIDPSGILEIGGLQNSGLVVSGVSTITSNINVGVGGTTTFFDIANRRVGVGTNNPQQKLNVYNGTPTNAGGILVQNALYGNNQNKPYLIAGANNWTGATTNWGTYGFQHRIKSNSAGTGRITVDGINGELFCIENGGNIGIGTADPDTPLHIYKNDAQLVTVERSTINNAGIRYRNTIGSMFAGLMSDAEGWAIDDDDNLGQNPMFHVVKSTGDTIVGNNLGVGNTDPDATLTLGSFSGTHLIRMRAGAAQVMGLDMGGSGDVDAGRIRYHLTDDTLRFFTESTHRATIDSDGLKFGTDTAAANALDDYEEGTWTPAYIGSTGNPTVTYDIQGGRYVKIGRVVHCEGRLRTDAKSGGSGNLKISGLPFLSAPESTVRGGLDIGVASAWGSNRPTEGLVTHNTTQIGLYRATSSGNSNITTSDLGTTTNDNNLQFSLTYMAAS